MTTARLAHCAGLADPKRLPMRMCIFPGCVSLAQPLQAACAVHAKPQGKPCLSCKGTGTTWRRESRLADVCAVCAGTGLRDSFVHPRRARPEPVDARGLLVQAQDWDPWED